MTPLINRNQGIPTRKSKIFTTEVDNQPNVFIQIYQGERQFVKDNSRLGGFQLGPIPPAPRGVPQIDVAFNIDSNGILFVTATDLGTKKKESITISNSKGRLSEQEIEKMIRDAKKFAESDRKAKQKMEARQALESLMRSIRSSLEDEVGKNLDPSEKEEMTEQLESTRKWLDSKKGKSASDEDFAGLWVWVYFGLVFQSGWIVSRGRVPLMRTSPVCGCGCTYIQDACIIYINMYIHVRILATFMEYPWFMLKPRLNNGCAVEPICIKLS